MLRSFAVALLAVIAFFAWRNREECSRADSTAAVVTGSVAAAFERAATFSELGPRVLSYDPYVVVFDTFSSEEECDELLRAVESQPRHSYKPSKIGNDGIAIRTSRNSWCVTVPCTNATSAVSIRTAHDAQTPVSSVLDATLKALHCVWHR